jgi:hypothetical protein
MRNELSKVLHKAIVKDYSSNYGASLAALETWKFSYLDVVAFDGVVRFLSKNKSVFSNENALPEAFDELAARGYIRKVADDYCLTEAGINEVKRGTISSFITFLDSHSGIATIVSVLALLATVIGIVVAI